MYKAVVFDLHGVIAEQGDKEFWIPVARSLGVTQTTLFNTMQEDWQRFERGEIAMDQFFAHVAGKLGVTYDLDSAWQFFVNQYESTHPIRPAVLKLVDDIRAAGCKVGLLSNTNAPHVEINRQRGLESHFDVCLYSNEIGALKPEPLAYQILLDSIKVDANELIFIDDLAINLTLPHAMGIFTIEYKNLITLKSTLKRLGVLGLSKTA